MSDSGGKDKGGSTGLSSTIPHWPPSRTGQRPNSAAQHSRLWVVCGLLPTFPSSFTAPKHSWGITLSGPLLKLFPLSGRLSFPETSRLSASAPSSRKPVLTWPEGSLTPQSKLSDLPCKHEPVRAGSLLPFYLGHPIVLAQHLCTL